MTTTPPGWYDDGHGAMRWWDGSQWTEHVAQPDPEPSADAPTEAEIVAASARDDQGYVPGVPVQAGDPAQAGTYAAQSGDQAGYPPHPGDPAAYLAAHPGYGAPGHPGGGFTAATEPTRSSKLWILWLVLGLVLLGIVIAAAVLIPLLLMNAATSGAGAGAGAESDDERAAVAAVELYDEAWQDADCDAFEASTTDEFRASTGIGDCDSFVAEAELFDDSVEEYEVRIDDVATAQGEITVTTTETYLTVLDDTGAPLETPEPMSVVYTYTVVTVDGEWAIDAIE